jgi:hypothetical protein
MKPGELRTHVTATYFGLRLGMAVIAIALPVVLGLGGYIFADLPLQKSMSEYYHAGGGAFRTGFVGPLFAIAVCLYVYKGFTSLENYALNAAAISLVGIAVFPSGDARLTVHGVCAVLFFVCIAYVAVFRAQDTLELIAEGPDGEARRKRYESIYFWLGVGMIVFPAIGVVLESILGWGSERKTTIFFVETAGVVLFAVFWFVKTRELAETDAEGLAVEGKVETPPQGAVELFAEKRVTRLGSPLRK